MSNPFRPPISRKVEIDEDAARKEHYANWRKFNQLQKAPFLP